MIWGSILAGLFLAFDAAVVWSLCRAAALGARQATVRLADDSLLAVSA